MWWKMIPAVQLPVFHRYNTLSCVTSCQKTLQSLVAQRLRTKCFTRHQIWLLVQQRQCQISERSGQQRLREFGTPVNKTSYCLMNTCRRYDQMNTLQWRHNERDGVSNHQPHHCLLKRLFRRRSKKTSKLRVTGLCEGNSPVTGEFSAQMASDAENVSIWWRHNELGNPPTPESPSGLISNARCACNNHIDVMAWKTFPHYWPFERSLVDSHHKRPVMQSFGFPLLLVGIGFRTNGRVVSDLGRHVWRSCDVTVMRRSFQCNGLSHSVYQVKYTDMCILCSVK